MRVGEHKADLLPCPFCGWKPVHWENTVCDATIRCQCGVRLQLRKPFKHSDDDCAMVIISQWNTRQPDNGDG